MAETLQICETFTSIQGESTRAGEPCFFIRLAGCNLRCAWCDTPYAQNSTNGESRAVAALVREACESKVHLFELTGGEPLIQPGALALMQALVPRGTVLVETNGSCDLTPIPSATIAIMDLKSPSSGESSAMRWENMACLRPQDEVKFVIADRTDYLWARDKAREHDLFRRCRAVLMGPVQGRLTPAQLAAWILEDRLPARMNLQLHKIIWPQRDRGV